MNNNLTSAMYCKKYYKCEAHQVPPEGENGSEELCKFLESFGCEVESIGDGSLHIHNWFGGSKANPSDWIVKQENGSILVYSADVFENNFERIYDE